MATVLMYLNNASSLVGGETAFNKVWRALCGIAEHAPACACTCQCASRLCYSISILSKPISWQG